MHQTVSNPKDQTHQIRTFIPSQHEPPQRQPHTGSQRPSESSNNSMDENISDSELEINLNSKVLTNQTCAVPMPQ